MPNIILDIWKRRNKKKAMLRQIRIDKEEKRRQALITTEIKDIPNSALILTATAKELNYLTKDQIQAIPIKWMKVVNIARVSNYFLKSLKKEQALNLSEFQLEMLTIEKLSIVYNKIR